MKVGVLTSGYLGAYILEKILFNFDVKFVLTDSNSKEILKICKKNKILFFKGNPRKGVDIILLRTLVILYLLIIYF